MNLLLDTVTFLWISLDDPRLPKSVRQTVLDPQNVPYFSIISSLEVSLKVQTGKLLLPEPLAVFLPKQQAIFKTAFIGLDEQDVVQAASLPSIHRDPFDRLLVAQAIRYGLSLVTPDAKIKQYPVPTIW